MARMEAYRSKRKLNTSYGGGIACKALACLVIVALILNNINTLPMQCPPQQTRRTPAPQPARHPESPILFKTTLSMSAPSTATVTPAVTSASGMMMLSAPPPALSATYESNSSTVQLPAELATGKGTTASSAGKTVDNLKIAIGNGTVLMISLTTLASTAGTPPSKAEAEAANAQIETEHCHCQCVVPVPNTTTTFTTSAIADAAVSAAKTPSSLCSVSIASPINGDTTTTVTVACTFDGTSTAAIQLPIASAAAKLTSIETPPVSLNTQLASTATLDTPVNTLDRLFHTSTLDNTTTRATFLGPALTPTAGSPDTLLISMAASVKDMMFFTCYAMVALLILLVTACLTAYRDNKVAHVVMTMAGTDAPKTSLDHKAVQLVAQSLEPKAHKGQRTGNNSMLEGDASCCVSSASSASSTQVDNEHSWSLGTQVSEAASSTTFDAAPAVLTVSPPDSYPLSLPAVGRDCCEGDSASEMSDLSLPSSPSAYTYYGESQSTDAWRPDEGLVVYGHKDQWRTCEYLGLDWGCEPPSPTASSCEHEDAVDTWSGYSLITLEGAAAAAAVMLVATPIALSDDVMATCKTDKLAFDADVALLDSSSSSSNSIIISSMSLPLTPEASLPQLTSHERTYSMDSSSSTTTTNGCSIIYSSNTPMPDSSSDAISLQCSSLRAAAAGSSAASSAPAATTCKVPPAAEQPAVPSYMRQTISSAAKKLGVQPRCTKHKPNSWLYE